MPRRSAVGQEGDCEVFQKQKAQDTSREPSKGERELVLTRVAIEKRAGSNTSFYLLHQGNQSTAWKVGNTNGLYLLHSY